MDRECVVLLLTAVIVRPTRKSVSRTSVLHFSIKVSVDLNCFLPTLNYLTFRMIFYYRSSRTGICNYSSSEAKSVKRRICACVELLRLHRPY